MFETESIPGLVTNLNDMVLEADAFLLLSGSVLHVEGTDEVSRPAPHQTIEDLQD